MLCSILICVVPVQVFGADNTSIPRYNRDDYLPTWADADSDCQSTRHEVLIAESLQAVELSANGCFVEKGRWYDPYTATTFIWPFLVDIDHLVPLSEAHRSGAYLWTGAQKQAFANDLRNPHVLIAVDHGTNEAKGDKDPAQWLPPNAAYHCEYIQAWVAVKRAYGLTMDAAEQAAVDAILPPGSAYARTEAPISRSARYWQDVNATFALGVEKTGTCGFLADARTADAITITVEVRPAREHVGQVGNLYLVVRTGGTWLMLQADGRFAVWDSHISSLVPFGESRRLRETVVASVFTGKLNAPGEHAIYMGYSAADGELIFTPVAVPLLITP